MLKSIKIAQKLYAQLNIFDMRLGIVKILKIVLWHGVIHSLLWAMSYVCTVDSPVIVSVSYVLLFRLIYSSGLDRLFTGVFYLAPACIQEYLTCYPNKQILPLVFINFCIFISFVVSINHC